MKNLKTKIGLSVLALACLGAGTITLNSNVFAKADEADGTLAAQNEILMAEGADICVSDGFSGIRWKTSVAKGYTPVSEFDGDEIKENTQPQYGVLVAPTGTFGDFLTFDDVSDMGAMDLAFSAGSISTTKKATIKPQGLPKNTFSAYCAIFAISTLSIAPSL